MKTRTNSNPTFRFAGALGSPGRPVGGLRLETRTSGCLAATPNWEVLK
jgi:hypothetical protein